MKTLFIGLAIIANMPITNIPYPYTLDTDPRHPWPWHMDAIHIQQLYRMCERIRPRTVVEVGGYKGASTSAFAEAMKDGLIETFTCYEIRPTKELHEVLAPYRACWEAGVVTTPYPEDPIYADLILIDGDHEHGAVADTLAALCMGCPHIVMHDSNSHTLGIGCHGVRQAVGLLKAHDGRKWCEDITERAGMHTQRGLFYSRERESLSGWMPGDLP